MIGPENDELKKNTVPDGKTALHNAAASGAINELRKLIKEGADIDEVDNNGTTALHFAAWENHIDCVEVLLQSGVDPNLAEGEGWTALHDAVRREYPDIILAILGKSRDVKNLESIRAGIASCTGDERFNAILELLGRNQVPLGSVGICGQSLLHDAVERGYLQSVKTLIAHGVNVNQLAYSFGKKKFEGTPLHKAAAYGSREIFDLLISAGADETVKNIDGKIPSEIWDVRKQRP